jgi:hypothetical protein
LGKGFPLQSRERASLAANPVKTVGKTFSQIRLGHIQSLFKGKIAGARGWDFRGKIPAKPGHPSAKC